MNDERHERYRKGLDALAAGRFDDLSPEDMAALEAYLNEHGDAAAWLADIEVEADAALRSCSVAPSSADWERVWQGIEEAAAAPDDQTTAASTARAAGGRTPRRAASAHRVRWSRTWAGMSIAAAIVLAVGLWQAVAPRSNGRLEFRLAQPDEVEIETIEVFGGATSFVMDTGGPSGTSIIWIMEEVGS